MEIQRRFLQFDDARFEITVKIDECLTITLYTRKLLRNSFADFRFFLESLVLCLLDTGTEIRFDFLFVRFALRIIAAVITVEIFFHLFEINVHLGRYIIITVKELLKIGGVESVSFRICILCIGIFDVRRKQRVSFAHRKPRLKERFAVILARRDVRRADF